jgi:hypothetical protein
MAGLFSLSSIKHTNVLTTNLQNMRRKDRVTGIKYLNALVKDMVSLETNSVMYVMVCVHFDVGMYVPYLALKTNHKGSQTRPKVPKKSHKKNRIRSSVRSNFDGGRKIPLNLTVRTSCSPSWLVEILAVIHKYVVCTVILPQIGDARVISLLELIYEIFVYRCVCRRMR